MDKKGKKSPGQGQGPGLGSGTGLGIGGTVNAASKVEQANIGKAKILQKEEGKINRFFLNCEVLVHIHLSTLRRSRPPHSTT